MFRFTKSRIARCVVAFWLVLSGNVGADAGLLAPNMNYKSASAKILQSIRYLSPDTLDPTLPGVGTNRYAYAGNDQSTKPTQTAIFGTLWQASESVSSWAALWKEESIVVRRGDHKLGRSLRIGNWRSNVRWTERSNGGMSLLGQIGVAAGASAAGGATTRALIGEPTTVQSIVIDSTVGVATLGTLKGANRAIHSLPPTQRGRIVERLRGYSGGNSRVIDNFNFRIGAAVSHKSIDLASQTYQNPSALTGRLQSFVRDLGGYQGGTFDGASITDDMILSRTLDVTFSGRGTAVQQNAIESAAAYARGLGIGFRSTTLP